MVLTEMRVRKLMFNALIVVDLKNHLNFMEINHNQAKVLYVGLPFKKRS